MGVLSATTVQKLQNFSELPEVYGKAPDKLQAYIDRAELILSQLADIDKTLPGCTANLELATNLLAENLIVLNTPNYRRSAIANKRSETIGSYSYSTGGGSNSNSQMSLAVTDEIRLLLTVCRTDSDVKSVRTHVFTPREVIIPGKKDDRYYIADDQRVEEVADGLEVNPTDPRQR